MNQNLNNAINSIFKFTTFALAFLVPLFFWGLTSEFFDTPKFLILAVATGILLVLWTAKFILSGKVTIIRTPLDLPFLLLLAVFVISTFFAPARWVAIFGNLPRIHWSLAAFAVYILLYFALASNLKQTVVVKGTVYILTIVGIILSLLSLLYYSGETVLNIPFAQGLNFTPTGSTFSTTALLVLLLPFLIISILNPGGDQEGRRRSGSELVNKAFSAALLTLFLITIALTGIWPTVAAAVISIILTLYLLSPTAKNSLPFIAAPVIITLVIAAFSFFPIGGDKNPFYTKAQNFPKEIQLPLSTSWDISVSAFRDMPFWGSGPASYLFDFTAYKPADFNSSKFWSVNFDQPFNEYLQFLATVGSLGLIALLLLTAVFISTAVKSLKKPQTALGAGLALSGMMFFVLLALHTSTLPLWGIGILILMLFMVAHRGQATEELNIGLATTKTADKQLDLNFNILPVILLVISLGLVGFGLYFTGRFTLADYHHRKAIVAVSENRALDAYNQLVAAETFNPYADLYRTDMAQTNFAIANSLAVAKGPSQSSPSGSLTDQDKQNIQTLLSQAIAEGKVAVFLSPNNSGDWEVLGSIYRQISGVAQNALSFALDAYGRAIQKDPLNPLLRLTVGGIYYSAKNYDLAIRFFNDAVNIKPDYANGYYNLAVVLRDKGDLQGAIASAERTVSLLDPKSPDYKVASNLLADLKAQSASETAKLKSSETAPAAQTTQSPEASGLENKNLPKVLNLPKPENIATPPAVKK